MKKEILKGITALLLVANLAGGTQAFAIEQVTPPPATIQTNDSSVRAEEVSWVYKKIDGVCHKRLWSHTQGKWLNDWTRC